MPSSVSKEDLQAHIYSAGVHDPRKLNEVMRLAQVYALSVHRQMEGMNLPEDIPETFTEIKPGEWNKTLEITCCAVCERVKRWDEFHVDQHHPSRHKTTCRICRRGGEPPSIQGDGEVRRGGWLCSKPLGGCGKRRAPEDFPPEKQKNPRKPVLCVFCAD